MTSLLAKSIAKSKTQADDALLDFIEALNACGYCVTDMDAESLKEFISDYCQYVLQDSFLPSDRVNDSNKHWYEMQRWDTESQSYFLAYLSALLVFKMKNNV